MITTHTLADALGRKAMADALGVGLTAVSNAVVRGQFPASWFLVVRAMAETAGKDCPPALFGMKDCPQSVNSGARVQGDEAA